LNAVVSADQLDPLTEPRPEFGADAVADELRRAWGVRGELTPLHGERDLNFRVTCADGMRYVAKVHNPADGDDVVDFQTRAVRHVRDVAPDVPVGDVVAAEDGSWWHVVRDERGRACRMRLLTHLDGRHPDVADLDDAALFGYGRSAGALTLALRGFFHPAAGYPIAWDIRRLPALRERAETLPAEQRSVVLEVIDEHESWVAPQLSRLRGQVVHNDISPGNVLVGDDNRVTGITDFGDMTHTAVACDLAVTITDLLDGDERSLGQAEAVAAGYASVLPLESAETDLLAHLVAGRCAAALAIQTWRAATHDVAPEPSSSSWLLLQLLRDIGLREVGDRLARAAGTRPVHRRRDTADLAARRRRVLGPLELSYREPLHLVSGTGVELRSADGRTYVDAYNNVPVLGHSHPAVTAAVSAQLRLLNTNSRYLHEAPIELAETLLATMPAGRFDRVLFVNSGSEANDLAWRIACFATGRSGGVVTDFAYHGVTTVTTALSPEAWGDQQRPAQIRTVAPPPPVGGGDATADVAAAVAGLDQAGIGLAAMFVDGVFTSDGVLGPAHGWTRAAAAAVHAAGGLYVADEVQAGYGRTGDDLWSFAAGAVDADLVTLGKPMGNGFPVAAVVARAEHVDAFIAGTDYFSTFGGNMVACAAALAVLGAVQREGLVAHAREVGAQLADRLGDIASAEPRLAPPRHWGLAVGVDVRDAGGAPDAALAARIVDAMRDRGVLIGRTAATDATLKIRPPLAFTGAHADRLTAELAAALSDLST
jgi:4-aminobutyrate aminotransferase-like enzyme/Ser/Thr protein kinase RdoA (MazF antagonist)